MPYSMLSADSSSELMDPDSLRTECPLADRDARLVLPYPEISGTRPSHLAEPYHLELSSNVSLEAEHDHTSCEQHEG